MAWSFSPRSLALLFQLHPDLAAVMRRALDGAPLDFGIDASSVRTAERQQELLRTGRSRTQNSRHIPAVPAQLLQDIHGLPIDAVPVSHAVDILVYQGGKLDFSNESLALVGRHIKAVAAQLPVRLEWGALKTYGGDWHSFNDMAHFQLPWADYPVRAAGGLV